MALGLTTAVNAIQDLKPEVQALACACLFTLYQKRVRNEISTAELITLANNIMYSEETGEIRVEFVAMGDYLKNEI